MTYLVFSVLLTNPVEVGKHISNVLMYADDLVLMSNSKEGLQKCLEDLNIYCNK